MTLTLNLSIIKLFFNCKCMHRQSYLKWRFIIEEFQYSTSIFMVIGKWCCSLMISYVQTDIHLYNKNANNIIIIQNYFMLFIKSSKWTNANLYMTKIKIFIIVSKCEIYNVIILICICITIIVFNMVS